MDFSFLALDSDQEMYCLIPVFISDGSCTVTSIRQEWFGVTFLSLTGMGGLTGELVVSI
jgi:hypothetical protein